MYILGGVVTAVFVFGSNLAGRHGKGAALHAKKFYGAQYGVGVGRTGNAYAIPTKDSNLRVLAMEHITNAVQTFLNYAYSRREVDVFLVTAIGCGLAGYQPAAIAKLFTSVPENVYLTGTLWNAK